MYILCFTVVYKNIEITSLMRFYKPRNAQREVRGYNVHEAYSSAHKVMNPRKVNICTRFTYLDGIAKQGKI